MAGVIIGGGASRLARDAEGRTIPARRLPARTGMATLTLRSALASAILALAAGCSGDDGKDGNSCTVSVADGGTATIVCDDGTTAEVASGTDGDSCSVEEDTDDGVKTITCDDGTTVTVSDGEAGASCTVEDNEDGTKTITCEDGTTVDVADGLAGDSCTVEDNEDGTKTITCEDGTTVDVTDGQNGGSCTVTDNGNGTSTIECEDGSTVTVADGEAGLNGGNVEITNFHGTEHLETSGAFAEGKLMADAAITSATADADGLVTVQFTVADEDGEPVLGLPGISANIAKLVPAAERIAWSSWVPYLYRTQTVTGVGSWPAPDGTSAVQSYRENSGTLTENGAGAYTYVFATDISAVTGFDGMPVAYDRSLTHRVSIMMGGSTGATATATYDFVPDGSALTEIRDIVRTETCQQCHGEEFRGHGGDRLTVQNCATCHVPGNVDPHGADGAGFPGESLDLKVMIHKIHSGGELFSIPGADGLVWDDPATGGDESADNGTYAIWGYQDTMFDWWEVGFPAVIDNCTKCHQGEGAQVDNWKENPSRAACGSCHDDVDFATGTNHAGGIMADDDGCQLCHPAEGVGLGGSITDAHDWYARDPRLSPEFGIGLSVSAPANGSYFVDGESPVVTIVLTDTATGAVIDHTTVAEDAVSEGCTLVDANGDGEWDACPARDGLFKTAGLFVHGPRAQRMPVLTSAARAAVLSSTTGPFNLSAASASLIVKVDGGQNIHTTDVAGGDVLRSGTITVLVSTGVFASTAAATTTEIVTWLNANTAFAARAIAYDQGGKVGIRSRNLGDFHAVQLSASEVTTQVFANDLTAHLPTGYYATNNVASRTNPANNDPKAVRNVGNITYTLDPVDDLEAGTYVVRAEFADAASLGGQNYRTTSDLNVTFQVGSADEEPLVARNCGTCHQSPAGTGLSMHTSRELVDSAPDTCISCHDYQPMAATGAWGGAKPFSRRVHAVHYGSSLNYPNATVDHSDIVPGRNWEITLPQDVRNCEVCHTAETSGTWSTRPARLPCSGCHDSDAANAHIQIMTFDPTPLDPWSGDEQESCQACHAE